MNYNIPTMFKVRIACYTDWDTSSEIPFVLKKGGCSTVDAYCSPNSWLLSNSYIDKWIRSDKDEKVFKEKLVELVKNSDYQWVLMADDALIKLMNEMELEESVFKKLMPLNKIENRYMLSSKIGFSQFCASAGLLTPKSIIYNRPEDLELIKSTLNFPIVNKRDFSSAGTDMFVSNTLADFESDMHLIPINHNVLIQEYIIGTEIQVEALFFDGILVTYTNGLIVQTFSTQFSFTTRRKYFKDENLTALLKEIGLKLGLNSFSNIAFIYKKETNQYYLFEVDPRPNSWIALSRFVTPNNFFTGVERIVNGDYKKGYIETPYYTNEMEAALFFKDMRRILWHKDIKGLMSWIFNIKGYWRFLPFYDWKLTRRMFVSLYKEIIGPKLKRIFGRA
jgi:glutathione synthase/RimK-type ligase-like ATP-grasp enzyme